MTIYRTPLKISDFWHKDIELGIEAGTSPIMELGMCSLPTLGATALLALQQIDTNRTDVTKPIIAAGGLGPLWTAALLGPQYRSSGRISPQPTIVYSGTNDAEYFATTAGLYRTNGSFEQVTQPTEAAATPSTQFYPHTQPGMSVSANMLPFLELSSQQLTTNESFNIDTTGDKPRLSDPLADWLAWAALLLSLFLVLLAIVL